MNSIKMLSALSLLLGISLSAHAKSAVDLTGSLTCKMGNEVRVLDVVFKKDENRKENTYSIEVNDNKNKVFLSGPFDDISNQDYFSFSLKDALDFSEGKTSVLKGVYRFIPEREENVFYDDVECTR